MSECELIAECFQLCKGISQAQRDLATILDERHKLLAAKFSQAIGSRPQQTNVEQSIMVAKRLAETMKSLTVLTSRLEKNVSVYQNLLSTISITLSQMRSTEQDSKIVIWTSSRKETRLLNIPVGKEGKLWPRVLLFVESVCGSLRDRYVLQDLVGSVITTTKSTYISAGNYALVPEAGSEILRLIEGRYDIIPSTKSGASQSSSVSGHGATPVVGAGSSPLPAGSKRKIDSESDSAKHSRSSAFVNKLYQRDNHCVITKSYVSLEASHILAHTWWKDTANRRQSLPENIIERVTSLADQIDDVRNGLLMRTDLAKSFDRGEISLQWDEGHFSVVALVPACEKWDGIIIDRNMRARDDGTTWWEQNSPDRVLIEFHLRNSVFAHLVAAGSDYSGSDSDDFELSSNICEGRSDYVSEWVKTEQEKGLESAGYACCD